MGKGEGAPWVGDGLYEYTTEHQIKSATASNFGVQEPEGAGKGEGERGAGTEPEAQYENLHLLPGRAGHQPIKCGRFRRRNAST